MLEDRSYKNHENSVDYKLRHLQSTWFLESDCSLIKYWSLWPNTQYLYLLLPFLKTKEFRIILQLLMRYGCTNFKKPNDLINASYMVEGWRVKLLGFIEDPQLFDPISGVDCFSVLLKTLINMCEHFVKRIYRGLVKHFDEPAMNLCLFRFLRSFGIQYIRQIKMLSRQKTHHSKFSHTVYICTRGQPQFLIFLNFHYTECEYPFLFLGEKSGQSVGVRTFDDIFMARGITMLIFIQYKYQRK